MAYSWIVLIPPIAVLVLSLLFKHVIFALSVGIVSGAWIASYITAKSPLAILGASLWAQVEVDTLCIFTFLIVLGVLIALMNATGGTQAYAHIIQKKLKNKKSAETASIILSCCFLIDDFFSALTVGSIMRPLTDKFHIARAKLAFLLDAMAAPLVVLVPVSSWIATLASQFEKGGISLQAHEMPLILADPFVTYLSVIPFICYSFISICSTIFIVRKEISFGPMAQHELVAQTTGNLFDGKPAIQSRIAQVEPRQGSLIDFLIPLFSLILCTLGSLLYFGNFSGFGGTRGFAQALLHSNIFLALCFGSLLALGISLAYTLTKKQITVRQLLPIVHAGFDIMGSATIILLFAWTFSTLLKNDLQAGTYIAQLIVGTFSPALLPAGFFIASTLASIATGSSWGTIAVMVPLAVPIIVSFADAAQPITADLVPLLSPLLGAVLGGAIAGDQISPIASTTLMSSSSSGCYHKDHVYTQLIYALPILASSFLAYIIAGYMTESSLPLWIIAMVSNGAGIGMSIVLLVVCQYLFGTKHI